MKRCRYCDRDWAKVETVTTYTTTTFCYTIKTVHTPMSLVKRIVSQIQLHIRRGLSTKALQLMKRHKYDLSVGAYKQIIFTIVKYMYPPTMDIDSHPFVRTSPYELVEYIFYRSPYCDILDPNAVYRNRRILDSACAIGCIRTVRLLLNDPRIYSCDAAPLVALNNRRHDIVCVLLERYKYKSNSKSTDLTCFVIFRQACDTNQPDVVRLFLTDPIFNDVVVSFGSECLHFASQAGFAPIVRLLLEDGRADPSYRGDAALCTAAWNGHYDVVLMLISHPKVNPYTGGNNFNLGPILFSAACKYGWSSLVEQIVTDIKFICSKYSSPPLEMACQYGRIEVVRILLNLRLQNLHIDSFDKFDPRYENFSPILVSSQYGKFEICKLLIEFIESVGSDITADTLDRCLIRACRSNSADLVSYILERIPGTHTIPSNAFTEAVFYNKAKNAILLIEDGRVDILANRFEAIQLAISGDQFNIIDMIFGDSCNEARLSSMMRIDYVYLTNQATYFKRHDMAELFERRRAMMVRDVM